MPCHTIQLFDFICIYNSALKQTPGRTGPMEREAGADLLEGLVHLAAGMQAQTVCKKMQPLGRTDIGETIGVLSHVGGTPHQSQSRDRV